MTPQTKRLIFVLKSAIRAGGLTLKELEKRLGVSPAYLTRLFSGQIPMRVDQVAEIAEVAGLDPDEIFRLAFPAVQKPVTPEMEVVRRAVGAPSGGESPASESPAEVSSMLGREIERLIERMVEQKFNERAGR